jgi:AraC-like DNA-binding protein
MDVEDAFSLSDAYIQKCELLNQPDQILNLQYHMILEYTQKTERIRLGKRPSKLAIDVANYIQHHLSEAITAEDIAKELYLSRPYLSRKFIEETGENLTDFILKEKTEEGKRLLRYSDKSLTAISNYLGFSSQSHFSRVFKKYAEITPGEYRDRYNR